MTLAHAFEAQTCDLRRSIEHVEVVFPTDWRFFSFGLGLPR